MAYRIFISFSAKDKDVANSLKRQLAIAGVEVSTAELLVEGSEIKLQIADALRQSDEVIAIVSKNSVRSQWLSFEVGIAAGLGKKLLPVMVGITPSELPPVFRSFHVINLDEFPRYVAKFSDKLLGERVHMRKELKKLDKVISALRELSFTIPTPTQSGKRRTLSVAARRKIGAAQRKRWAKVRRRQGSKG